MGGVRSMCRDCGGSLPSGARFCPGCGLPADTSLDGQLRVDSSSDADVTAIGPSMERSRPLIVGAAVIGALLLTWSVISSAGEGSAESVGSTTTAATVVVSTTTIPVATTVAEVERSTTSGQREPAYVNGVRGRVLGDGVEGVVFIMSIRRVTLIDLATGEIRFVTLDVNITNWDLVGFDDGEMRFFDGYVLHTVDLMTGAEDDVAMSEISIDAWIVGHAGPESVWLVTEDDSGASSTVSQVDFSGETLESFEFGAPFWVRSATGTDLYLDGPGGSWVFDTVTASVTELNGEIIETGSNAIVLLSCESMLECEVSIDTGTGFAPTSALSAAGVTSGEVHFAPDFTAVFVHRSVDDRFEFTYIDLGTGNRVEFGELPIVPWQGIVWVPDTPWIIAVGHQNSRYLLAVNTSTGAILELDLPGVGVGVGEFGFIPAS